MPPVDSNGDMTRRRFVQSAAATGAGLMLSGPLLAGAAAAPAAAQAADEKPAAGSAAELKVAIIGAGSQGRNLILKALKIPGIRFVAVCDIWPYAQKYAANILKKYDQPVNVYAEYGDMLAKEQSLDAVIVATPDWVHAEQSIACLRAGKHVYCEKEMSNTIEEARKMVLAARETGKLLQIGHQRRSNPRYWHAMKLIDNDKVLGRITHAYGQWNRARLYEIGWPKGEELDEATLRKYGYDTMDRFCNWRWFRKYSGGAMADLGSHQVDVFSWILKTNPRSVIASGGLDYYNSGDWKDKGREWYDNVMAIYEYQTPGGLVRAFYQVLNTTSHGAYFEQLMGDEGSMVISEDPKLGQFWREVHAKRREWENESEKIESMDREAITLKIGETLTPEGQKTAEGQELLEASAKDIHQLHLENFFDAVRGSGKLTCPAEVAFETAVAVLKANEAVEKGCRVEFKATDFKA